MKTLQLCRRAMMMAAAGAIAFSTASAQQRTEKRLTVAPGRNITLTIDSVAHRTDVTRLYGKLIGKPHTSQKIQSIHLQSGAKTLTATDIDGIDFERHFQWEDNGSIDIEVDFPPTPSSFSGAAIIITTPKGSDRLAVTKTLSASHRKGGRK